MAKVRFNPPLQWENWCGWLIAAPWLLDVQSSSAKFNFVVVGALVVTLAIYKLWYGAIERQGAIGRLDS